MLFFIQYYLTLLWYRFRKLADDRSTWFGLITAGCALSAFFTPGQSANIATIGSFLIGILFAATKDGEPIFSPPKPNIAPIVPPSPVDNPDAPPPVEQPVDSPIILTVDGITISIKGK